MLIHLRINGTTLQITLNNKRTWNQSQMETHSQKYNHKTDKHTDTHTHIQQKSLKEKIF